MTIENTIPTIIPNTAFNILFVFSLLVLIFKNFKFLNKYLGNILNISGILTKAIL